jgi:hypothetical protein
MTDPWIVDDFHDLCMVDVWDIAYSRMRCQIRGLKLYVSSSPDQIVIYGV